MADLTAIQDTEEQAIALGEALDEVTHLQAVKERVRDLADELDQDAADDDATRHNLIDELIMRTGVWSSQHPEVARLSSLVKVQRRIAKDLRDLLTDDPGAGKTSAEATR